jgi:hypothetical protein
VKFFLLLMTIPLALASCTMTDESASRGGQQLLGEASGGLIATAPDTYRFRNWQMGGVTTWANSMGSTNTTDNQASFKDAMQAVGAVTTSVYAYKAYAAAELTKRVLEGEITKRQGAELANKLALATTEAEVTMFMAGLEAAP